MVNWFYSSQFIIIILKLLLVACKEVKLDPSLTLSKLTSRKYTPAARTLQSFLKCYIHVFWEPGHCTYVCQLWTGTICILCMHVELRFMQTRTQKSSGWCTSGHHDNCTPVKGCQLPIGTGESPIACCHSARQWDKVTGWSRRWGVWCPWHDDIASKVAQKWHHHIRWCPTIPQKFYA